MGLLVKRRKGHLSTWPPIYAPNIKIKGSFRSRIKVSVCVCLLVFCVVGVDLSWGEVLTPPYFNLAQGRRIYASATCGESADGYPEKEMYCNLVGATTDTDDTNNVIHGQYCDFCEKGVEGRWHPAEYAIDGSERWWQSPPLSRGVKYNEINLTIDLGQKFHVAYVNLKMANSPRPGVWVLERSSDGGKTYKPWQYFAENPNECTRFFGKNSTYPLQTDDGVVCDINQSKVVPLENGEIYIRLLEGRPSANNFFASDVLQEWTRATHVRLSFLRTKTLLGHLMSVSRQDTTVTRRYFYSVKGIEIGGRCICNGHADICPPDLVDNYKLLCSCQHNTCGPQCESCCERYVQKAWRVSTNSTPFVCEACNCFGHTNECEYDEEVDKQNLSLDLAGQYDGGGVCKNCRHNTEGINCDKCKPGYFRPYGRPLDATDVCQPCNCRDRRHTGNCEEGSGKCICADAFLPPDCDACNLGYYDYPSCKRCDCNINGTRGQVCEVGGGQCPCHSNFGGQNCDQCADGYFNFPACLPCECEDRGSVSPVCDPTDGKCECANNYGGRQCDQCENGYFNFPTCSYCNCDVLGTVEGICDKGNGKCLCREGYGGERCDQCIQGFYGYPECKPCNCSAVGSASTICDATGKCPCLSNFSGRNCGRCTPGYYQYPECLPCSCHDEGSMGVSCDDEGKCQCKRNFDGLRCEECFGGFYNFPLCEECNCDPAGTKESFGGCADSPPGELCQCKDRVEGRICNVCKPLFWNLQHWNPSGCEECDCYGPGIIGGVRVCENKNGQCPCKNNVGQRRCEKCKDGFYNLTASDVFGCQNCGCDVGGSVNGICDKESGQCPCRPRIEGQQCTSPLKLHYFPTLFQYQYEAEDGSTPSGGQVRFGYDNDRFPDYSWRGYAIYTTLQPETNHEVYIEKSSLYLIVLRYNNPGFEPIVGEFRATPDSPSDEVQFYKVKFEPRGGGFLTVSISSIPTPFVLNPGRWTFSIKTDLQSDQHLLVDYFTLLPANYYEGTVLSSSINDPCYLNTTMRGRTNVIVPDSCVKFKYPSIDKFDSASGVSGYASADKAELTKFYSDKKVIDALDINDERMAVLSNQQQEMHLDLQVSKGGRYAILIEYFTPQGANLTEVEVRSTSKKGSSSGVALIHNCKLAFLCRQVVTTPDGEVAIFRFDSSSANIVLQATPPYDPEGGTHLDRIAVNSVTAIPLGRWSLDHITPRQFCIMKNETCINTVYDLPPDYVKVEAESGDPDSISPGDSMPEGVADKNLVLLDSQKRVVEINGKVPSSGYYTVLVHYYQPENPEFSADVLIQDGQHYQAKLPFVHCPSTSGCRAQVAQEDKNSKFYIQDNFMVTVKSPKNVWIDYILLVPIPTSQDPLLDNQLDKYLIQSPLDDTRKFIAECGKSHFYLSPQNVSLFCRDAVFSISADYNNGALPCQCDYYGSTAFECVEFGGQCPCRENVIGRRCERCRTGYFGFPECKPCDCPSTALCDEGTGACICPQRVTGEKCDQCEPYTYGFDALIGCEECNCSPLGVENGNLQCNLTNGHCTCKPNVVGRTCDKCKSGFWAFPYCQMCDCDIRGTTGEVCNQENSACDCKPNVEGRNCEQCKPGSFNLQEENPSGCTTCFCFGKTTRCSTAYLIWTAISFGKSHWTAVALNPASKSAYSVETGYELEFEDNNISDEDETAFAPLFVPEEKVPLQDENNLIYFKTEVNANHLASVGGHINYVLVSEPSDSGDQKTFSGPDVILEGRELAPSTGTIRLMHFAIEHLDGKNTMNMNLHLSEENFVVASHSANGGLTQATRDQLMIVLKGLKAVYVRAGYWMESRELRLISFNIDVAVDSDPYRSISPDERAVSVEQCQCPPNYQGLSCEECAPGYYRSPSGPFGGFCVPCQCHGHSNVCDPVSGICLECQNNTTGDHCDTCEEGFHGDAKGGTPYDCLICACPIPIPSNNFATQCELSYDGRDISCTCKDGYIGPRCEACGPGFYGQPEYPGDYCKPCSCSGNIDPTDPSSCDTVTGACLRCMNNTGGPACNLCAPGFYGDALLSKNCKKCSCNECGTQECDNTYGECRCLRNVEGFGCDRCRPDHYGLGRCDGGGCQYCDCGIASITNQCDDLTGQCECRKGTTGRRCERCAPGYWNYTEDGCQSCECNSEYAIGVGCDPATGQCSCLTGVIGEKCDRCPWRWVLIEDRGCQACGPCQHQLLDVTDQLAAELDPVMNEFENVAVSYFTTQKLTYFNDTVSKLRPNVQLMDPSKADLSEYYIAVDATETNAATQRQKAELIDESLVEKVKLAAKLRDKSLELENKVREASLKAENTVRETKDWVEVFTKDDKPTSSPQAEQVKAEAEAIFGKMQSVTFDRQPAIEENDTVTTVLKDVKAFVRPLDALSKDLTTVREQISDIKEKIKDLKNESDHSIATSRKANEIGKKIREAKFSSKIGVLETKAADMQENMEQTNEYNEQIPKLFEELKDSYGDLDVSVQNVKQLQEPLQETVGKLMDELNRNENTVAQSQNHARQMKYEADGLQNTLDYTKSYSDNAIAAATSYQTIVDSLRDAAESAEKAQQDADLTTTIINNLHSAELIEPSKNQLVQAENYLRQVEYDLKIPLRDAKGTINTIEGANNITTYSLNNVQKELKKLSDPKDLSDLEDSIKTSTSATKKTQETLDNIEDILENLPAYSNSLKKLRVEVNELNSGTGISDTELNQAKDSIPLSNAITGGLEEKKPVFDDTKNDVAAKMSDLKAKIAAAREHANRVHVGMNLNDDSSLLLANPQSLESQQAQTKVSFFFKTADDGLLFYLGNEPGRKEEDFMTVEVDRGYPVLMIDLGSGPQRIMNDKYVADNQWYKATVDRSGKTVRFTIAQEDQNGHVEEFVKEEYLLGSKSLFNVDRNSSRLYVGGLPPGVVRSPVRYSTYRGAIEDLVIGDEKVGLWNFKDAQNVAPAHERDRFIDLHAETGLRFQGNGYAILDRTQFPLRERSAIGFQFKTRSKNGLIFLVGRGRKYMAIYMSDGNIAFQYDLGGGPGMSKTTNMYNDGQWHTAEAVRYLQNSYLTVDTERINAVSPGSQSFLAVGDYMYFGGYPGEHNYPDVSNREFDGCLKDVTIDSAPVDLTQAVESRYTIVGCPSSQFAPTVATFFGQGFVQVSSADKPVSGPVVVTKDDTFELNFRLRTNETDGLLFYGNSGDQSNWLSVALYDGSLSVQTDPGQAEVKTDPLNDADWHVVTITRDKGKLIVNVDDAHEYATDAPNGPIQLNTPGSSLLFGGRPDDFTISGGTASERPYTGCLADISINGNRLDFSDSVVKDASVGQKCFTAEEKNAMSLEMSQPATNGRRISEWDEDDENNNIPDQRPPFTTTLRTTTTTTTKKPEDSDLDEDTGTDEDEWNLFPDTAEKQKKEEDEVKPTPYMSCALPYREAPKLHDLDSLSMEDGVMFGNLDRLSRLEFNHPSSEGIRSEYSIDFKTSSGDGLIFMFTMFEKSDYIALFMRKGFLHFAFDSGAGPAFLNSTVQFNDSNWHTASISRFEQTGELSVDGKAMATGSTQGATKEVNAGKILYVGGLPVEGWSKLATRKKLLGVDSPFKGCLRNLKIRGISQTTPIQQQSVEPCTDNTEQGFFFYPNSGFLKFSDNFKVGREIKLSMSIKPRHPTGILVAVQGDKDFMVLQLINGTVKFTVDSGKGTLSSSYSKEVYDLCDGNWHTITVTKSKNVVMLALDNRNTNPGIGQPGRDSTNTNGPLFVGGHPNPSRARGVETTEQFVGCMKDFVIEGKRLKISHDSVVGTVGFHSCPTD